MGKASIFPLKGVDLGALCEVTVGFLWDFSFRRWETSHNCCVVSPLIPLLYMFTRSDKKQSHVFTSLYLPLSLTNVLSRSPIPPLLHRSIVIRSRGIKSLLKHSCSLSLHRGEPLLCCISLFLNNDFLLITSNLRIFFLLIIFSSSWVSQGIV